MSYVVYEKSSTYLLRCPSGGVGCYKTHYASEGAAKAALTRMVKKGKVKAKDYAITDALTFSKKIEKIEVKRNLMSGKEFIQPVNTPLCCDPSSETYWSM